MSAKGRVSLPRPFLCVASMLDGLEVQVLFTT